MTCEIGEFGLSKILFTKYRPIAIFTHEVSIKIKRSAVAFVFCIGFRSWCYLPTDRKGKTKEIKGKFPLFAEVPTTPKKAKRLRTLKNADMVALHSAKGISCKMSAKGFGCSMFNRRAEPKSHRPPRLGGKTLSGG